MKRRIVCFFLLLLLLLPSVVRADTVGENLLVNPGFEELDASGFPVGWSRDMYVWDDGVSVLDTVSDTVHGGTNGARIRTYSENDARFSQTVKVEPDSMYRLSGYARVSGVTEGMTGANLSIENVFTKSNAIDGTDADGQWRYLEVYGITGPDQYEVTVFVRLGYYGSTLTGTAWFDDISLEEVEAIPEGAAYGLFWRDETPQSAPQSGDTEVVTETEVDIYPFLTALIGLVFALLTLGMIMLSNKRGRLFSADKNGLYVLLALALVVRVILGVTVNGYPNDIACWQGWGERMLQNPSEFYTSGWCDYPPAYMYVLALVAGVRRLLNAGGMFAELLVKLPAIVCDLGIGYMVWLLSDEKQKKNGTALLLCAFILLDPAAAFDSAAWGQIDSVLTLLLLVSILLCVNGKFRFGIPVFAVSALVKPQALMLAPVALTVLIVEIVRAKEERKKLLCDIGIGLGISAGAIVLLLLPVWGQQAPDWILLKYTETLSSYDYATINAMNVFEALSLNWASGDTLLFGLPAKVWGYLAMGASIGYSAFLYAAGKDRRHMPLCCAVLVMFLFTFSTKMHERYAFPAIALLLAAYLLTRDGRLLLSSLMVSFTQFVNMALVLRYQHLQDSMELLNFGVSMTNVFATIYLCLVAYDICKNGNFLHFGQKLLVDGRQYPVARRLARIAGIMTAVCGLLGVIGAAVACAGESISASGLAALLFTVFASVYLLILLLRVFRKQPDDMQKRRDMLARLDGKSDHRLHMKKADWITLLVLTAVYAVLAFTNLGTLKAPQTEFRSSEAGESIVYDLGEEKTFNIYYYGGITTTDFDVEYSSDGVNWTAPETPEYREGLMFQWLIYGSGEEMSQANNTQLNTARYVRVTFNSVAFKLREIGFMDADGKLLPVTITVHEGFDLATKDDPAKSIDEQDTIPLHPSYMNGMYFDEIYHARTAYEHLTGLHTYEWTHPPLGKVTMMLGILLFGMCPFGWRFMGALTGVLMVPAMYLLTKQLFKRRDFATFTTVLMTFDFMHFTQTRLATIDSYGVFYIMLMFLFMIRYLQMSFFRDGLGKTLIPLGLSGIFMGIGCAAKWIDIYAGAGLAVLFFAGLFLRWREYVFAGKQGIRYASVRKKFVPYTLLTLAFCCVFFVLIPLLIYYFSYYWQMKPDGGLTLRGVWNYQVSMLNYHAGLSGDTHPFRANWYTWPLILKPMYYYSGREYCAPGTVSIIWAMGNPVVWYTMLPAMLATLGMILKKPFDDRRKPLLAVSFLAQYLPWVLVPRSMYIYHYFASVPFLILSMCFVLEWIEKKTALPQTALSENGKARKLAPVHIVMLIVGALAVIAFAVFYPVISGATCASALVDVINSLGPWYLY